MNQPRVHIAKYYSQFHGYNAIAWCGWVVYLNESLTCDLTHPALCKRCLRAYDKATQEATR